MVGFSLFRRTGSRTANPTSQGVSLRGLGASGASRALVLADGLPLNDPFGGWVYWARAPRLDVERLEVLRGGAADLYGSGALGGVIQVFSRDARRAAASRRSCRAAAHQTFEGALSAHAARGAWAGRLAGEAYQTDGYIPVEEASRGAVDTEAASKHMALDARVERSAFGDGRVFLRGQYYDEDRKNGTPLQTNDTRIGLGALGVDFGSAAARAHDDPRVGLEPALPPVVQRDRGRPLARGPDAAAARAGGRPRALGAVDASARLAPPGAARAPRRATSPARPRSRRSLAARSRARSRRAATRPAPLSTRRT